MQGKLSTKKDQNVYIKTYGCQMNVYDSEKMFDLMHSKGYKKTDTIEDANLIILNTCHIREKAAEKVYSELGKIRKLKSSTNKPIIAVAGCVSQAEKGQIFNRAPFVDIIVGPQSYHHIPTLVEKATQTINPRLIELDFIEEEKFDKLPEETYCKGASKFISIQEGCDKFCTYCVVPYTRGAEFSRPLEKVYREVLLAVESGAKEITLLGQNVNAYHGSFDGREVNLAFLIDKIANIEGLKRIRYTTSHPADVDEDLIEAHGNIPKLMPFLHLPVQSGSDKVLKLMNRRYSKSQYLDIIERLKAKQPHIALSSDFIVGFPGETDEDFQDTLDIVREVGYSQCYSFKYSQRPGTPATKKVQIPERIKTERLMHLQKLLASQQLEFNRSFVGKTLEVLFDRDGKYESQIMGKTQFMQSVYVKDVRKEYNNKILKVKTIAAHLNSLEGEVLANQ